MYMIRGCTKAQLIKTWYKDSSESRRNSYSNTNNNAGTTAHHGFLSPTTPVLLMQGRTD
jgi:hypothetical protein